MSDEQARCPIWGFVVSSAEVSDDGAITVWGSVCADGDYRLAADAIEAVQALEDDEKARLTYRLVKARQQGTALPVVDRQLVEHVRASAATSVHERAVRVLEYIATATARIGENLSSIPSQARALAWSESIDRSEVYYLLEYLQEKNWVRLNLATGWQVTVDGYSFLEEQRSAPASSQAFVAMWFDSSMDDVYAEGIKPAIEHAGYMPLRIDRTEHINKIDDEVIRELRRSRFVVADFTSGDGGARGSVYYEAGFAHGLGIPVIWTCRSDQIDDIHFDTRQYAHIPWCNQTELRDALEARIGAVIGEGPHTEGRHSPRLVNGSGGGSTTEDETTA